MGYTVSGVCRIAGLTCMGCCGREYGSRRQIWRAVRQNTYEYGRCRSRQEFRDRPGGKDLRSCGVCRQVIFTSASEDAVTCPLHPCENAGTDLRIGHCDIRYLCKAAVLFDDWDEAKRRAFMQFVGQMDLDWLSFSMGMDSDSLVDEFLAEYGG